MTQQPQAKYRHDYRAPDYQITDIDLTFDRRAKDGRYRGQPAVRHGASDAPLRLDGEDLKLVSVHINDEPWTARKKKRAHWSSVICRSVLRLRSLMKLARRRIPRWKGFISQAMRFAPSVKPKVSAILRIISTARTCWRVYHQNYCR